MREGGGGGWAFNQFLLFSCMLKGYKSQGIGCIHKTVEICFEKKGYHWKDDTVYHLEDNCLLKRGELISKDFTCGSARYHLN